MHLIFSVCMGGKSQNCLSGLLIVRLFGGWLLVAQSSGWSGTVVGSLGCEIDWRSFGLVVWLCGHLVVRSFNGRLSA